VKHEKPVKPVTVKVASGTNGTKKLPEPLYSEDESPQLELYQPPKQSYHEVSKKHFLEAQVKNSAGGSLGCDIGSDRWMAAKKKSDAVKNYSDQLKQANVQAIAIKKERMSRVS